MNTTFNSVSLRRSNGNRGPRLSATWSGVSQKEDAFEAFWNEWKAKIAAGDRARNELVA